MLGLSSIVKGLCALPILEMGLEASARGIMFFGFIIIIIIITRVLIIVHF